MDTSSEQDLKAELNNLKDSLRTLRRLTVVLAAGVIALPTAAFVIQDNDIIRTKGIIVEDSSGRARILIGAPIPQTPDRIRNNREKVLAAWGPNFGGKMDWFFERVKNDAYGMLVLDENGHDRVAVGSPNPDPNIGPRIAPQTGMIWNNKEGFERGGVGHLFDQESGVDRSVLGLDNRRGEGAGMVAYSDGTNGVFANDGTTKRSVFVGLAPAGSHQAIDDQRRLGMIARNEDGSSMFVGSGSSAVEVLPPKP